MKKGSEIFQILIGLVVLIGLGFVVFWILEKLFLRFATEISSPEVIAAMTLAIATIVGYFVTKYLERKALIEAELRRKKVEIYEELLGFLFKVLKKGKLSEEVADADVINFMYDFSPKAILWLSDKSLHKFVSWRIYLVKANKSGLNHGPDYGQEVLFLLEDLFFSIREELGNKRKILKQGDLLSLVIDGLK